MIKILLLVTLGYFATIISAFYDMFTILFIKNK